MGCALGRPRAADAALHEPLSSPALAPALSGSVTASRRPSFSGRARSAFCPAPRAKRAGRTTRRVVSLYKGRPGGGGTTSSPVDTVARALELGRGAASLFIADSGTAVAAAQSARGGSLCVRRRRLPADFSAAVPLLRDPIAAVQLIIMRRAELRLSPAGHPPGADRRPLDPRNARARSYRGSSTPMRSMQSAGWPVRASAWHAENWRDVQPMRSTLTRRPGSARGVVASAARLCTRSGRSTALATARQTGASRRSRRARRPRPLDRA